MKWQPFAFNNVCISVPDTWDLSRFAGNSRQGDLVLDDGRRVRLEAQWGPRRGRDLSRLEERLVGRKRPIEITRRLHPDPGTTAFLARETTGDTGYILRVLEQENIYQLLRVFAPPGNFETCVRGLLRGPGAEITARGQPWRFFATRFLLPAGFLLTRGELRAGCMRLDFARRGRELTVWDFSLLDQLQRREDPAEFACALLRTEFGKLYHLREQDLSRSEDRADFHLSAQMRLRWLVHPRHLLAGNRRAWARGIPNRRDNRFALVFHRFRSRDQDNELHALVTSLRDPEGITW